MNLLAGLTNTQRPGLHKKFWTGSSIQLRKMELTANIFTQKTSETSLGLISARWALMVSSDSSPTMAVCFTKCFGTCVMDVSIYHPFSNKSVTFPCLPRFQKWYVILPFMLQCSFIRGLRLHHTTVPRPTILVSPLPNRGKTLSWIPNPPPLLLRIIPSLVSFYM